MMTIPNLFRLYFISIPPSKNSWQGGATNTKDTPPLPLSLDLRLREVPNT
jgi:hypothetical protein